MPARRLPQFPRPFLLALWLGPGMCLLTPAVRTANPAPMAEKTAGAADADSLGPFASPATIPLGQDPVALALADLEGDGRLDLAVTLGAAHQAVVRLGRGDGGFGAARVYELPPAPTRLLAADFDRDGRVDLAVAAGYAARSPYTGTLALLFGTGYGSFGRRLDTRIAEGPAGLATGDLDHDGLPDVVAACALSGAVSVLRGDRAGAFGPRTDIRTGAGARDVALLDLDGDGQLDIAALNSEDASVTVLRGAPDGSFTRAGETHLPGIPLALARGDLDGDGRADLAVACAGIDEAWVLLSVGDGTFYARTGRATGAGLSAVALADFDGDGALDLVTANRGAGTLSYFAGQGNGLFGARTDLAGAGEPLALATGDLDGDGAPELVALDTGDGTAVVYRNRTPRTPRARPLAPEPARLTLGAAHPNPFRRETSVEVVAPAATPVRAVVLDARGALVAELSVTAGTAAPGRVGWDGRRTDGAVAPPGIYFLRVIAGGEARALKLVLAP